MGALISDNLTILLAEDDQGHSTLIRRNLWQVCVDANIVHFPDGQQLLAYLRGGVYERQTFEPGRYVILMDIRMPALDGIETLAAIKQSPTLRPIPVFMLTTTTRSADICRCFELGCAFYIVKPVDYRDFMEAIAFLGGFLSMPSLNIPFIEP